MCLGHGGFGVEQGAAGDANDGPLPAPDDYGTGESGSQTQPCKPEPGAVTNWRRQIGQSDAYRSPKMQMADRVVVEGGPAGLAGGGRIGETALLSELCAISKSSQAIDTGGRGAC